MCCAGVWVCLLGVCHESLGLSMLFIVLAGWCLEVSNPYLWRL